MRLGHEVEMMSAAAGYEGAGGGREAHHEGNSEVARARIESATPRCSVKEPDTQDPCSMSRINQRLAAEAR
jgi:hypothetical protein